jgi:stage II sporulation protein D
MKKAVEIMKNFLKLILILSGVMVIIPLFVLFLPGKPETESTAELTAAQYILATQTGIENIQQVVYIAPGTIRILDEGSGEVVTVPLNDYVIGAVMAEMPASFPEEALKAQAAAVRTYAIRAVVKAEGDTYDISNASGEFIPYWNEAQGRAFYTDGYEEALERISAAVEAVSDTAIVYNNEPIAALYHSTSPGRTESANNVWGGTLPYLQSVTSPGDELSPFYKETVIVTEKELKARLSTEANAVFTGDPDNWIEIKTRSEADTVLSLRAGDKLITGQEFREIFGLKSAAFYVSISAGNFYIVTNGYGHGAGLSQYGAKAMAEDGKTWQEIVLHYYSNVEIVTTA